MRKVISVLLIIVTMSLGLAACGSDSSFVGTWKATGVMANDKITTFKDSGTTIDMEMEIKGDGTVNATSGENTGSCTWTEKDGKITVTEGSSSYTGEIKDDNLLLTISGLQIVLEKQK